MANDEKRTCACGHKIEVHGIGEQQGEGGSCYEYIKEIATFCPCETFAPAPAPADAEIQSENWYDVGNDDPEFVNDFSSYLEAFDAHFGGLLDALPGKQRERAFNIGQQYTDYVIKCEKLYAAPDTRAPRPGDGDAIATLLDQYRKALERFGVTFADNGFIRHIPALDRAADARTEQQKEAVKEFLQGIRAVVLADGSHVFRGDGGWRVLSTVACLDDEYTYTTFFDALERIEERKVEIYGEDHQR